LDLQKFPETNTFAATMKYGFSSKYSSLFFLRHAHVLQILKFYVFSQRNRQALEHVCCHLDKLELSYSSWVMGSLTWSLYTVRQIEKRGAKTPTLQVPWSSRVGFYSVSFLPFFITSFAYFSSYLPSLPSFPHFCFLSHYLFIYLFIVESNYQLRHVCLSVPQHGTTRLPLDWFSWNLISEYFSTNTLRKFEFHYNLKRQQIHQLKTYVHLAIFRWILLTMRNVSGKFYRKSKRTIYVQ